MTLNAAPLQPADLDAIILCGGQGTRLREETEVMPKPMVQIGDRPMLWHIMKTYARFGVRNFILCLGYKGDVIRDYFLNYRHNRCDLIIDLKPGSVEAADSVPIEDWRVILTDTGEATQTGARLRAATKYLRHPSFFATYGDGVANVDLDKLYHRHLEVGRAATVTAVHPTARFGEIAVDAKRVTVFHEKPQVTNDWVNGGFFVFERAVFEHYRDRGDDLSLEQHILPDLAQRDQLGAYHHDGFWQCMDTYRDVLLLNELSRSGRAPWMESDGS